MMDANRSHGEKCLVGGWNQGFTQAFGVSANAATPAGSWDDATSARETPSRIWRTFDRSAIHSGSSDSVGPEYDSSGGRGGLRAAVPGGHRRRGP